MSPSLSIKTRVTTFVVAVCIATSAGAVLALVDTRPENEKAAEWATSNSDIPDTLDEMARVPPAYRRAAFKVLPASTRYTLWRENLQRIASGPLTPQQRSLVLQLSDRLRPEFYADIPDHAEAKKSDLAPLCEQIAALFSVEQRRMLATLGPIEDTKEGRLVTVVRRAKSLLPSYVLNASKGFHDCECVWDTHCLDCDPGRHCGFAENCSDSWFGCGCAAAFGCTKMCANGDGR